MPTAKVFQSGNSQAIRIPKEMHTNEKEFVIRKYGDCLVLIPKDDPWALLRECFAIPGSIPESREQPVIGDIPERLSDGVA